MAVLVRRFLRAGAFGLVVAGTFTVVSGGHRLTAGILLVLGLLFALLFLWLDWIERWP